MARPAGQARPHPTEAARHSVTSPRRWPEEGVRSSLSVCASFPPTSQLPPSIWRRPGRASSDRRYPSGRRRWNDRASGEPLNQSPPSWPDEGLGSDLGERDSRFPMRWRDACGAKTAFWPSSKCATVNRDRDDRLHGQAIAGADDARLVDRRRCGRAGRPVRRDRIRKSARSAAA